MTKTVKLTQSYIKSIKHFITRKGMPKILAAQGKQFPTLNGKMFCYVDRSPLNIANTGARNEDIVADMSNVPIYNLKTDSAGRQTIDLDNEHSIVSLTCYDFDNGLSEVVMPIAIADSLAGFVEEV